VRLLQAASCGHLLRHPVQLGLALLGLTLGVGTIVAVDIATASARRAFELSLGAVNGAATHELSGGPQGVDEAFYAGLRTEPLVPGLAQPDMAPIVSGYVVIGDRTLELIGIDPFAGAQLGAGGPGGPAELLGGIVQARRWFGEEGAVVMGAATAAQLHLAAATRFSAEVAGVPHEAHLLGTIAAQTPGFDALVLTDIAQAQEWLGAPGKLSRIDLRLPGGRSGAALEAALRARLPAGTELRTTRAVARETFAMTDAFTTNLEAMSLLALLVGTFLIYGAVSFTVLQRRRTLGILRALGATRAEVLRLLLAEAALLGVVGAGLGVALGVLIGRGLVTLVSRTINDLYFVIAVNSTALPPLTLAKALVAGVATALVAALLPALEVAGGAPQLGLARSVVEARAQRLARQLLVLAAVFAAGAALTIACSARSLMAGFLALFLLLLAVAAATPAALSALAGACARMLGQRSALMRLALTDVARSLSRTGVAVAALGMALAAMIGVAVMVESFRGSLREWLLQTLRADIYVSAPGPTDGPTRRLQPEVLAAMLAVPGVRAHSEARRAVVASPYGDLELNALRLGPAGGSSFRLTQGEPHAAWRAFDEGAVLVSEPLAWRLHLAPGATLTLGTPAGQHAFAIAGVYREYGNDRGEALIELGTYQRLWHDDAIGGLGLYLSPGVDLPATEARLRAAAAHRQVLLIRSNAAIRELSMQIFERTFVITRVLNWLAAGVAAIGLISALLAWELERARELALLRTLGVTPRGTAALIVTQTLFMGLAAFLAALPAGVLTALVLTRVINRRAFGWQIDLHLSAGQFLNALLLALAAALAAGLFPAWRSARASLAAGLRAE
jgi:putative ABC transport system permease protein